ncbi:N-acetylmuramoyl-L-alanine amidase family protein [Ferruginibacter sp.]|nr:N-acetylmuramoyl-L-alanine amidase [Ferruginibacter sp.]
MLKNKVPVLFLLAAFNLLILSDIFSQKKIRTIVVDAGHGGSRDPGATGQYENSLRSKEKDITLAITLKLVAELKKQMPDVNVRPTRTTDVYQDPREKARLANEFKGDLFLCIHADSGPLKQGKRQIGTREETRYKITYKKVKKKKVKISTPYTVTVPVYEYFKMPLTRSGTSVWIFAAHKTSDKLKAILDGGEDFEIETDNVDSTEEVMDMNSPEMKTLAQIYASRFQLRSDKLAGFVNEEVEKTGRNALGISQRQKGIWVLQATNMPAILIETGFINNPEDERYLNSEKGQQELAESITAAVKRYKDQVENANKSAAQTETQKNKDEVSTPAELERPTKDTKILQVKSDKVKVEIYDDGEIDNDIVSVYFNKALIVANKALTAKAYSFNVELVPGKTNELVLYADNLGSIPPNTALMIITDGVNRYEVRLSADLKNNASIRFEFKSSKP